MKNNFSLSITQSSVINLFLSLLKHSNCFFRESVEGLKLEKLKLQDQCLCLEAEVLEKEEKLQLQEEEYQKQNAVRVRRAKELEAVVSHWTEKWQKVALTLQATQEELEELKKEHSRNEVSPFLYHNLKNNCIPQ